MRPDQMKGVIQRIQRMRTLIADGKDRTKTDISIAIGTNAIDTRKIIEKMIFHSELEVSRIGLKNVRYYKATRFLGHGIKLSELSDVELPTPEGVLMLQEIVMQQRALRLAEVRHG